MIVHNHNSDNTLEKAKRPFLRLARRVQPPLACMETGIKPKSGDGDRG